MKLKQLIRFFTSKSWRGHKRRLFFQEIFEDLKDKESTDKKYGSFSGIKSTASSFQYSCHDLAKSYDYYPSLDKSYGMNIGTSFLKYRDQNFDSLYVKITRISSSLNYILKKSGEFLVEISGRENGEIFNFSYTKTVRI